jgi:hypothetical protein
MWTREENWKKRQFCPTLLPTACTPLQNPMEKSVTKNKICRGDAGMGKKN